MNVRDRFETEEFWHWSLEYYGKPKVSAACLTLQDAAGADVNLLLLALWLAASGYESLNCTQLTVLDDAVTDWRTTMLLPLRAARRALGPARTTARSKALARELAAEKSEQALLIAALPVNLTKATTETPPEAHAGQSLDTYARLLGQPFDPEAMAALLASLSPYINGPSD